MGVALTAKRRAGAQMSASASPGLTVDARHDADLDLEDTASLETLIEDRPEVGVFLSKAWLSGFFVEPRPGVEPSLVVLREGGKLRGLVPISVRRTLTHVRVDLLGGALGSDRVDLLAARGFEAACADRFLLWLREAFGRRAFALQARDVPAESPLWGAVQRAGLERTQQLVLQPREIYTLPYLDLRREPCFERPRSVEKQRRLLERGRRVKVDTLEDRDEVRAAFECLAGFLHNRWRGQPGGSVLDAPRMLRFHRRAIMLLLADGRLRMIRLTADDRTIAVFYGLAAGAWRGYYLAGYDRDWAGRIQLGKITLATAIETAVNEGAAEFDFLKGAERLKYLWPVRARATLDADIYSAASGAQLRRASQATRDAAAAFGKSACNLFLNLSHP